MSQSQGFSSRWAMMPAMLSMAVGTGNIWRFPRIVGNGGDGRRADAAEYSMRLGRILTMLASADVLFGGGELGAQSPKPIGLINGGTVLLESKSVQRSGGIITAALRVQFHKPTKVPGGNWYSSRTLLMLDCRKQVVAVKENWYYSDAKGTKVAQHKEVGIPGYATPLPGSMPKVALDHLCQAR